MLSWSETTLDPRPMNYRTPPHHHMYLAKEFLHSHNPRGYWNDSFLETWNRNDCCLEMSFSRLCWVLNNLASDALEVLIQVGAVNLNWVFYFQLFSDHFAAAFPSPPVTSAETPSLPESLNVPVQVSRPLWTSGPLTYKRGTTPLSLLGCRSNERRCTQESGWYEAEECAPEMPVTLVGIQCLSC